MPLARRSRERDTMRVIVRLRAITLGLAITVAGCASPPNADVEAARAALDRANTAGAGQLAAESLKAAQDSGAALDAELKAQEGKWFKSYDKTTELAVAAKAAGDKAAADKFIEQYTTWDENLHGVVAANIRAQQKYRFRVFKYAALDE